MREFEDIYRIILFKDVQDSWFYPSTSCQKGYLLIEHPSDPSKQALLLVIP